ncbi:MAG: AI-2E family transporter, partial [Planctomycetota bacterium]|nr:AI-2E family transporter [Planctomycetota bacterium]
CIVTLDHSGISLVLLAIGMIAVVHIVEGYVLNPLIFGTHLKLNPVVVMIVLLVGHELAGIWGLLLGVPAITYLFGHAIRYDKA